MTLIWNDTDRTLAATVSGESIPIGRVFPDRHEGRGWKPWANARAIIWRWENKAAGGSVIRGARSTEADARAALEKSLRTCCLAATVSDAVDRLSDAATGSTIRSLARMDALARAIVSENSERTYRRLEALIGDAT